jgi:hypothetical protein
LHNDQSIKRDPFKYFKAFIEIIRLVDMMNVRDPLSFRRVEHLLHDGSIDSSQETA